MTRDEFETDLQRRCRAIGLDPWGRWAAMERAEYDRKVWIDIAERSAAEVLARAFDERAEDERQIIMSTVD
jgi:hypothetical protein